MAPVFGHPARRTRSLAPANYYVTDKGSRYRICVSSNGHGKILFVARKHSAGGESPLLPDAPRYREIVKLAKLEHKLK
jgi:hypothetical protein